MHEDAAPLRRLGRRRGPSSVSAAGGRIWSSGRDPVRLSWSVELDAGIRQTAYELQVSRHAGLRRTVVPSAVVETSNQIGVMLAGARSDRGRSASPGCGSAPTSVGRSGATSYGRGRSSGARDWTAIGIGPEGVAGGEPAPSPLASPIVRLWAAPDSARLYTTALGLMHIRINGQPLSSRICSRRAGRHIARRLTLETYDVAGLLRAGENVIAATLGDGWYRGRLGWSRAARATTERPGTARAARDGWDDGSPTVGTDPAWRRPTARSWRQISTTEPRRPARASRPGWDRPGFDDTTGTPSGCCGRLSRPRSAHRSPVREIATFDPQSGRHVPMARA